VEALLCTVYSGKTSLARSTEQRKQPITRDSIRFNLKIVIIVIALLTAGDAYSPAMLNEPYVSCTWIIRP